MAGKNLLEKEDNFLEKAPTGIQGLDEITLGGLPRGRATLVCGGPGCGKTLLGMEFLVHGALKFGEPGVFMCFEETAHELITNLAALGFNLKELSESQRLIIDHVYVEKTEIEETGEYDLEGLFIRLEQAINSIGAKRVVLDTIESLFAGLFNESILRAELRRLFRWLKNKGMTAVITGERGRDGLTRHGLEEYVSDCVVFLDQRILNQVATRRLHILKYRGSVHGMNEYPFIITDKGIEVFPITSLSLQYPIFEERITSGIDKLDTMLDGKGYYRGSTILISGTAGTGKTSIACKFVDAACKRGESCLYFAFEEPEQQILRNMHSIGTDLIPWVEKGLLIFYNERPTSYGLEFHLISLYRHIQESDPKVVVIDPISNFRSVGTSLDIKIMLTRIIDHLKSRGITTILVSLAEFGKSPQGTEEDISSLADSWMVLQDLEINRERTRRLYVLKSRGMAHTNKIHEFKFSDKGIDILDFQEEQ